jgi:hypothetical protein
MAKLTNSSDQAFRKSGSHNWKYGGSLLGNVGGSN